MQLKIAQSQLHSFVTVQILLPNLYWTYHSTNKTQLGFLLFLVYINCHKHNEYYCNIYLLPYLICAPSGYSLHDGAKCKVYLQELFQTDAFSPDLYPLIPKFQGIAWLKCFELN